MARVKTKPAGRWRVFPIFWGLPAMLWQTLFFVTPLIFTVGITFWVVKNFQLSPDLSLKSWIKMYSAAYFVDAYVYTFSMAMLSAVIVSLVAFPSAYTLAFHVPPAARRLAIFLLITPFFTSYIVRVYSWQIVLSSDGFINTGLAALGLPQLVLLNNSFSTMIGYMTLCLPLVILIQVLSLSAIDRNLIEAAHNLGCGRLRAIVEVILPSGRIGLILGACFAFMMSFGEYLSPSMLGGSKPPTLSILIVDLVKSGSDWPRASVVAMTMVVSLTVVLLAAVGFAYRQRRTPSDE